MDEILASIRRIIDAGESHNRAAAPKEENFVREPEPAATMPPPAANDAGLERTRVPQTALPNAPRTSREQSGEMPGDIAAAVFSYLEQERAEEAESEATPAAEFAAKPEKDAFALDPLPEPDISEVEAALRAEFNPIDRDVLAAERQAKYGARFTEEDDGVFRQVGSLLRGQVGEAKPAQQKDANALVSDTVSQSVSHSFSSLSEVLREKHDRDLDVIAEDMLRPMLQEWLDNNLPSLVERLVRGEIERIARGEPRTS